VTHKQTHTHTHTHTHGRTPWTRDRPIAKYLTSVTHNIHNRQTSTHRRNSNLQSQQMSCPRRTP